MYPEDLIQPMRQELIDAGLSEIRSSDEVKKNIESEGTTFVVINSVCGCAAANARPAVQLALKGSEKLPDRDHLRGNDVEAVDTAREMMAPFRLHRLPWPVQEWPARSHDRASSH